MQSSDYKENSFLIALSRAGGALAAGFGFVALLGWVAGIPLLTTFGPGKIPMAPSTALLFLAYGTAILLHECMPQSRGAHRTAILFGSFGTISSLLLLPLSLLKVRSGAEHLGLSITGEMSGAPIGHMSPLTAFCFLLAGVSFLLLLSSSSGRPRRAKAAVFCASINLLVSMILTVAYILGGPLLYNSGVIPPALTTSLAFLMLGTALLSSSGRRAWPRDSLSDHSTTRATYILILVFVLSAASIVTAGYFSFQHYQKIFRVEVDRQLSTFADLKISELVQWRKERLSDAAVFHNNDHFSGLVRRFLENPDDVELRQKLRAWLDKVQAAYQYDRVFLLDDRGVERVAAPDTTKPVDPHMARDASEVMRSGQVAFLDFHRETPDGQVHLAILVPILDDRNKWRPLGVLGLRIDPETHLYPLIRRWPAHSRTAETLLIRRDGNDALFLNELRFQKNTALTLRSSLDNKKMPAVQAALGRQGIMDGTDYRGVPVVAATQPVPDSPWYLVARMDAAEVYAPLQERLWGTMWLIGAMFLGAGAITGLLWRNQNVRFYRERYKAAEALRISEARYKDLYENAPDMYLSVDPATARIVQCNQTLARAMGYSKDEIVGRPLFDLYHPDCLEEAKRVFQTFVSRGELRDVELELRRKDGSKIEISINTSAVRDGAGKIVYSRSIWRDITDRKRAERRVEHLNRVLRAIRAVNQLIVREKDREQLIRTGCRLLVEQRSYAGALIVLTDESDRPTSYAQAGMEESFQPLAARLDRGELPPCCEQARQADNVALISDRESVCASCPIAQSCADTNTMCVRLVHGGVPFGYLMVSVEHAAGPDAEEQDLFAEMADDLAYALHSIMNREAGERAEQARQSLEDQLLQAQKMEAVGRLAGGVAHDFNNMLAVISGHAEMALEDMAPDNPLREGLLEIQKAAQRSADLTRQLLAFSRKQTIAPRILDLNDTIAGMLKMLRRLIGEDIDLLWKPAGNLWPVKMDPAQLDQVLANLVVNARDAISGVGKVTIETGKAEFDEAYCANHVGFIPGQYVMLAVSDDGTGMDRPTLDHIFEPFFTTKPLGQGTGLGLATVYGIVRQNNGFINVYSEPGQGTTFRIYLSPHEAEPAAEEGTDLGERPTGTETVLIVEDEEPLLKLGQRLLEQLGYTVLAAGNPNRAIELAREFAGDIHLLMTDVILPEMSGRDLWQQISVLRPGLKCLYMSGYTANVITHHGVLDQGVHFLQKPFSGEDLARKIREALEG